MRLRRLLTFLVLLALAIAPFGRMGMAEAKAMPHHDMSAMAPHCSGGPAPDGDEGGGIAVDCMIACAAMTPAAAPFLAPPPAAEAAPVAISSSLAAGIRPESEPPPPRPS
ncbi:MAG TPA: hypothetical protein VES64_00230 [Allosphingosinicella sp.]|nr:hypothetical protein [Allosphingosinicella sp.]